MNAYKSVVEVAGSLPKVQVLAKAKFPKAISRFIRKIEI